jgi:hypothetical protein
MSEVKTDKLTGVGTAGSIVVTGEGNSTTTNLQQGLCKAWAKTNAAGTTIDDSNNVASLTDNGAGDQTITMTNAMGNALYAVSINIQTELSGRSFLRIDETATSTTVYRTGVYAGSAYTDSQVGSAVIGDLA